MWKKLIAVGGVIALFLVLYAVDYGISTTYDIAVEAVNPAVGIADGRTEVTLELKLTRHGKPVEGHNLHVTSLDGGSFSAFRVLTDAQGRATIIYFPYLANEVQPLTDVRIRIRDQNNSIFIAVPRELLAVIPMKAPDDYGQGGKTNEDLFGE